MVVRRMMAQDVEGVYAVSSSSFSVSWSQESIAKELDNPAASYFVAEQSGEIAGYGGLWHMLDEGEIINIAVAPSYRQQKIGTRLLKAILEECQKRQLQTIFLEVRASNVAAQQLYKQFGFKEISRRKNYYQQPTEDAINMMCQLFSK